MPACWTCIAAASWLSLAAPGPSRAEIGGDRWSQLQSVPKLAPGPAVVDRRLTITPVEGGVQIVGRWRLHTERPAWFANQLIGPRAHVQKVRIGGRTTSPWATDGGVLVVERIDGDTTLELEAFVPGSVSTGMTLELLGAPRGSVELAGDSESLRVASVGGSLVYRDSGRFITGGTRLRLAPATPEVSAGDGPLAIGQVGVGLTVGDGEVVGRAHLRWAVRRGQLETVSFTARDVGTDLRVEGPNVAEWNRNGDSVLVQLRQPADQRVDLELSWTTGVSKAAESKLPVPTLSPTGVFRSESALQLARGGELDVIPQISAWTAIAGAQLPAWGRGLVEGTPTAAFQRPGGASEGSLDLVRYVPLPTPPMMVDVADIRVASSREGRFVMRARYEVLNERSAHLVFRPPAGTRLTGVTVAGQPVRPARDGDAYRIPLPRSIETLEGLSVVPVVVGLRGEDEAWARRRARGDIELPTVDAPVAVVRASHVLPPRFASNLEPGEGTVVDQFTRGHEVGFGLDDDRLASQADQVYAGAVESWNRNEFSEARDKLGELEKIGARNQSTTGLESNVDLVLGPEDPQSDYVLDGASISDSTTMGTPAPVQAMPEGKSTSKTARRIKAQVRARAGKRRLKFRARKKKAKELQEAGRYDEAEAEYERVLEEAKNLDKLEDEESKDYDFEAEEIEGELETTREQKASREVLENAKRAPANPVTQDDGTKYFTGPISWLVFNDAPTSTLPPPIVPILVPIAGVIVKHEFLLLESGAARSIEFDARRLPQGRKR